MIAPRDGDETHGVTTIAKEDRDPTAGATTENAARDEGLAAGAAGAPAAGEEPQTRAAEGVVEVEDHDRMW